MTITTGIYRVHYRDGIENFSYHYFNAQGGEVGMMHVAFPDHCMVFNPPRKWDPALKRTLAQFKEVLP